MVKLRKVVFKPFWHSVWTYSIQEWWVQSREKSEYVSIVYKETYEQCLKTQPNAYIL